MCAHPYIRTRMHSLTLNRTNTLARRSACTRERELLTQMPTQLCTNGNAHMRLIERGTFFVSKFQTETEFPLGKTRTCPMTLKGHMDFLNRHLLYREKHSLHPMGMEKPSLLSLLLLMSLLLLFSSPPSSNYSSVSLNQMLLQNNRC